MHIFKFKKIARKFFIFSVIACLTFNFSLNVYADKLTSDVMGYSILTSGGWGFGHTGIMYRDDFYDPNGSMRSNSVIHISSYTSPVEYGSYSDFIGGNNFIGYYCPKSTVTVAQRNLIISTAKCLKQHSDAKEIKYRASGQIDYSNYTTMNFYGRANTKVIMPNNITRLRCDGFVEYCYEYNNIRISGSDSYWNIAIAETPNQNWHNSSLSVISPKIQAYTYMNSMVGDINASGKIDSADARIALRISSRLDTPTAYQSYVADVDGDGVVHSSDGRLILQRASKTNNDDFPKNQSIKSSNPNNANGYSESTLKSLQSELLDWFI